MLEPMQLKEMFAHPGTVRWIGVRPGRREPLKPVDVIEAHEGRGLRGDHFGGKPGSKRQVTLIQHEHIAAVASILRAGSLDAGHLRRNIVVSGVNLIALVDRRFRIGDAVFEGSGPCHPCSRMEENLGPGGWNAMRGHGGITARVVSSGPIRVGDEVIDLGAIPEEKEVEES